MKILAVDTSSNRCSIAILEDNHTLFEIHNDEEKTHSQKLMPMIQSSLSNQKLNLSDFNLLACCTGPGSFTGIRIGISTIKAFADVTNIPTIGINSLESLTYPFLSSGIFVSLLDAKNNQVYFGLFEKDTSYSQIPTLLLPLQADSICNVISKLAPYSEKNITFLGNGSIVHKSKIKNVFANANFVEEPFCMQSASSIGKAAYYYFTKNEKQLPPLSPLYLKKSQAERALEEKSKQNGV